MRRPRVRVAIAAVAAVALSMSACSSAAPTAGSEAPAPLLAPAPPPPAPSPSQFIEDLQSHAYSMAKAPATEQHRKGVEWSCAYTVPPLPASDAGQVIFPWCGVERVRPDNNWGILQPVLGYGGSCETQQLGAQEERSWSFTAMYVFQAGGDARLPWTCNQGNVLSVSPGDTLLSTIAYRKDGSMQVLGYDCGNSPALSGASVKALRKSCPATASAFTSLPVPRPVPGSSVDATWAHALAHKNVQFLIAVETYRIAINSPAQWPARGHFTIRSGGSFQGKMTKVEPPASPRLLKCENKAAGKTSFNSECTFAWP